MHDVNMQDMKLKKIMFNLSETKNKLWKFKKKHIIKQVQIQNGEEFYLNFRNVHCLGMKIIG